VVAVVAVVDRAVRSAGKAFSIEANTGAAAMRPQSFSRDGFARSGFTPKSALPIIAALGGGPQVLWGPRLGLCPPTGLFVEEGADGPLFCLG
jgi:hypothetical protein